MTIWMTSLCVATVIGISIGEKRFYLKPKDSIGILEREFAVRKKEWFY